MDNISYVNIKDSIAFSFEEYIDDCDFTTQQATSKLFEEDWRWIVQNDFTKSCYFILTSIECFKRHEIPDFLFDKLQYYLQIKECKLTISTQDIVMFFNDLDICKEMFYQNKYEVVKTSFNTKSRIEYLLSLDNDL